MNSDKAVLRYRDGRTERVAMAPIDPSRQVFTVTRDNGENAEVPYSELKAVFFPHQDGAVVESPEGSTIAVEFSDGEVIRGIAHYNPEKNGFSSSPSTGAKTTACLL